MVEEGSGVGEWRGTGPSRSECWGVRRPTGGIESDGGPKCGMGGWGAKEGWWVSGAGCGLGFLRGPRRSPSRPCRPTHSTPN